MQKNKNFFKKRGWHMVTQMLMYMCSQKWGDEVMTTKMGRPTDEPKTVQLRIRLSEREKNKLEYCSHKLKLNKTEIIRQGIDKVYSECSDQ